MADEPILNKTFSVEIEVYRADIVPCFKVVGYDSESKRNYTLLTPSQLRWGATAFLDPTCSVNRNKFALAGEFASFSYEFYCHRDCEKSITFGPGKSYSKATQLANPTSDCTQLNLVTNTPVTYRGCFTENTWSHYLHFLKRLALDDWKVDVTKLNNSDPGIQQIYKTPAYSSWLTDAATGTYNHFYYYATPHLNSTLVVNTQQMFEHLDHTFVLVVRDNENLLAPQKSGIWIVRIRSWRGDQSNNYGFKLIYVENNVLPDVSKLIVSVFPTTGVGLTTMFDVSCVGAQDDDLPLTYNIGYSRLMNPTVEDCIPYALDKTTCKLDNPVMFPYGLESNDFKISICIMVVDSAKGLTLDSSYKLRVLKPTISVEELNQPDNILLQAVNGSASSGNVIAFASAVFPVLDMLNDMSAKGESDLAAANAAAANTTGTGTTTPASTDSGATTAPPSPSPEQRRIAEETAKRIAVRSTVIGHIDSMMSNPALMPTDDILKIRQVAFLSQTLQSVTAKPTEIDVKSATKAINACKFMTESLFAATENDRVSYNSVRDAGTLIMQASTNTLVSVDAKLQSSLTSGTAATTPSSSGVVTTPAPKSILERREESAAALQNLANMDNLANALSRKMVTNEKATELSVPGLGIVLNKMESNKMSSYKIRPQKLYTCTQLNTNLNVDDRGESLFQVPTFLDPTVTEAAAEATNQIIMTGKNPFVLADGGAANMSSSSMTVTFKDNSNKPYKMKDFGGDSYMEMRVPNENVNVPKAFRETQVLNKPMLVHHVHVKPMNGLFIQIKRNDNYTQIKVNTTNAAGNVTLEANSTVLLNNHTYQGSYKFHVFIKENMKPKEDDFTYFCQLPLDTPPSCKSPGVALPRPTVLDNATTTTMPPTTTGVTDTTTEPATTTTMWSNLTTTTAESAVLQTCTCSQFNKTITTIANITVGNITAPGPVYTFQLVWNCSRYVPTTVPTTISSNTTSTTMSSAVPTTVANVDVISPCLCNSTGCIKTEPVEPTPIDPCESAFEPIGDIWTCFIPPETLNLTNQGTRFFIGIRAVKYNDTQPSPKYNGTSIKLEKDEYVEVGYESTIFTTGCFYFDEVNFTMTDAGVYLGACSTPKSTQCFTKHLTSFMNSAFVPPIAFDPSDSAWLKLDSNPIAFALSLSLICFYFIVIVWARKKDKEDVLKVGVTPLLDNDPRDDYKYEITFYTGLRKNAGTTANVCIVLTGDEGETSPRQIIDVKRPVLQRGNVDSFYMLTPEYLGRLTHLRIWHDNTGSSPNWYFSRLQVEDLQTGSKYYFLCNRWFAVDEDDGMLDRIITVAGREELRSFEHTFWTKSQKNLYDGHIWFSIVTRPARSKFTRTQRTTACLTLVMTTMMVNLMFYGQAAKVVSPQLIEFGPVKVTAHSIFISTISALIIIPVNVLIVVLFKNRKMKPIKSKVHPMKEDDNSPSDEMISNRDLKEEHAKFGGGNSDSGPIGIDVNVGSDTTINKSTTNLIVDPEPIVKPAQPLVKRDEAVYDGDDEPPKQNKLMSKIQPIIKKVWPLPWWSYIIGYIIAFLTVVTCVYLMVEFGGVLGEAKTAEWLGSMMITLFQSILLMQPVKILAIALLYAIILKKPEEDVDEVTKEMIAAGLPLMHEQITMKDLQDPDKMARLMKNKRNLPPPPPDARILAALRERRFKEMQMNAIVKDIVFYIVFLVVLTMMAYTNQDYRTYLQNSYLRTSVFTGTHVQNETHETKDVNGVSDTNNAWEYIAGTLIPSLYPIACYNNEKCSMVGSTWSADPNLLLVRQAQLRQVRIKPSKPCKVVKEFVTMIKHCRGSYSMWNDEETEYDPGWIPTNASVPPPTTLTPYQNAWKFTSAIKLYGTPYSGELVTYSGGGYVTQLGKTRDDALAIVGDLQANKWLDVYTRGLFIEFLIYNPNTNLYSFSIMLLEFFSGGGVVHHHKMYTLKLNRYVGASGTMFMAIDIVTLILIVIFIYRECKEIHQKKCDYFNDFFNVLDISAVVCCIIEIVLFIIRMVVQQAVSYFMNKYPDRFINFQWLALWEEWSNFFIGMIVFIFTVRFLRLLSFNRKMSMFGAVLRLSAKPLGYFMIVFFVMFFAFMQMGYLMFYKNVESFRTAITTIETLGVMTLNKFDFTQFAAGGGVMGLIFFFFYMLFLSFILINFFITILMESFSKVKENWADTKNEFEIVDHVTNMIRGLFGLKKKQDNDGAKFDFLQANRGFEFDKEMYLLEGKLATMEEMLHMNGNFDKKPGFAKKSEPKKKITFAD